MISFKCNSTLGLVNTLEERDLTTPTLQDSTKYISCMVASEGKPQEKIPKFPILEDKGFQ